MLTRIVIAVIAVTIFAWSGSTAFAGGMMGAKTGDLNLDGAANSIDAVLVLQAEAGLTPMPVDGTATHAAADVNCDRLVNSIDASLILQADAGLYHLRA